MAEVRQLHLQSKSGSEDHSHGEAHGGLDFPFKSGNAEHHLFETLLATRGTAAVVIDRAVLNERNSIGGVYGELFA